MLKYRNRVCVLLATLVLASLGVLEAQAAITVTYYHTDASGSPVAASDESGEIIWREVYRPYGDRIDTGNNSTENAILYTGKPHDEDTGLTYFGARYYDPIIGRFMGIDPIGANDQNTHSFNRYAYANNNPYRYIDPDGNIPVETSWDLANVATGVTSAAFNFSTGNFVGAALDVVGVVIDAAAAVTPYVPGGASSIIKAAREGAQQVGTRSAKTADDVVVPNGGSRRLPFNDQDRITETNNTLDRIENGGPFPHKKDGTVFQNREGRLPDGNYREYTVETPGASNRGARRIVRDEDTGRTFYTDDHYDNFVEIDPTKR